MNYLGMALSCMRRLRPTALPCQVRYVRGVDPDGAYLMCVVKADGGDGEIWGCLQYATGAFAPPELVIPEARPAVLALF